MTSTESACDRAHMARAIAVGEQARRLSSPNPAVGCVLVRDGHVVAEAATGPVGGPHAEAGALALAGERARGATAYVTLEPCAHHGRTPPCAPALARARVARVVYGIDDPNPPAAGGAVLLREAGVEVVDGVLAPWVAEQLEAFLTAARCARPHVTLKLAHTVDGRLTASRTWVTGPTARRAVHRWRAGVDGVLVGSGTALADDPRLDVRHVPAHGGQPRPIVLDTRLRTPLNAAVVRPGAIVLCGPDAPTRHRRALAGAGVEVAEVVLDATGRLDLPTAMARLHTLGITSVLAEPGTTLGAALVAAGLVDRLVSHVALDLGEGGVRLPLPVEGWWVERVGGAGPDLVLHLRPGSPGGARTPSIIPKEH